MSDVQYAARSNRIACYLALRSLGVTFTEYEALDYEAACRALTAYDNAVADLWERERQRVSNGHRT